MAEADLTIVALSGVALLLLCEAVAWVFETRHVHAPGVPTRARLAMLATALAVVAGLTALVTWAVTLPIGDAAVLAALGVASLVLLVRLLLSLGSAASRS